MCLFFTHEQILHCHSPAALKILFNKPYYEKEAPVENKL